METITDKAIKKLLEDDDFKSALAKYEEAEKLSSQKSEEIALNLVNSLMLSDPNQDLKTARFNLIVARMTAAKLLATLSSFNYEEQDFMNSLQRARECVQQELVPMLMQKEPCGQCEQCKNGHRESCINPIVRNEYCESRFLPLLSDALIEYDAWSEILYNNIPQDKRDIDILKDINEEFQNNVSEITQIKKKRGRPPKVKKED